MRVTPHLVVLALREVDDLERIVDAFPCVPAVERGNQLEVAAARQVRVEARLLDEAGDPVERARPVHDGVAPEQLRRSLVGPDQPEQHPQRCRLPGSIGTQVAVDVPRADRQVDVVDRGHVAVALDQPARLDRRDAHLSPLAAFSAASGGTEPATV
jgi:hypothetical protein